jgi:COMPASS component SDC1
MGETNGASTPLGDLNINAGQVRPGGAPARVYLNEKIVPHLLDGMKSVAREQWVESVQIVDRTFH